MLPLPPFISYSHNREDVLINRLFADQPNGYFVDIGAAHPTFENDTKALYDRGWSGINVEPNPAFFRELTVGRPKDRNLNIAISESAGQIVFYEVVGTGLSTCDAEEARRAEHRGHTVIEHQVETDTLRDVLEQARPPEIDLLKVDVEGYELKVLASNDWTRFRPRVIVAEATFPESAERRPDGVSAFLESHRYQRVYFDGLNDYFVEQSFSYPADIFSNPVSVFDNYIPYLQINTANERDDFVKKSEQYASERDALAEQRDALLSQIRDLEQHNKALEAERGKATSCCWALSEQLSKRDRTMSALEADLSRANQSTIAMRDHAAALARDLDAAGDDERRGVQAMLDSTSWRITRPLRALRTRFIR